MSQFTATNNYKLIKKTFNLQLIFSGEYTKAMSKDWHSGHFCCWNCDESLTGQRYVLREEHPYCIKCYESVFANTCEECSTIIGIDSKVRKVVEAFKITLINLTCLFAFHKTGLELQRQTLARSVLLVPDVSHLARRQTVRLEDR
jgi:LIM domain